MNKSETVQALLNAIQNGDFKSAQGMLADEFQFSGPVPEVLNANAWLRMSVSLKVAFPDLDYHFKIIGEESDMVRFTAQLSGTHTDKFDLSSMMDMGVIPATHKPFATTLQKNRMRVKEGKVIAWVVEPTSGAGLLAILQQLDIYIADIIVVPKMQLVTTHN